MLKNIISAAAAVLLCAFAAGCAGNMNTDETLPETEATENGEKSRVIRDEYFVSFSETLRDAKYTAFGTFVSYKNDGHTADYTFEITEVIRGSLPTGIVHMSEDNGSGSLVVDGQPVSYEPGGDIYDKGSEYALVLNSVNTAGENEPAYDVPSGIIIPVNGSAKMYGLPLEEASDLSKNRLREILS